MEGDYYRKTALNLIKIMFFAYMYMVYKSNVSCIPKTHILSFARFKRDALSIL